MRDLALLCIVAALIRLAFHRPWLGLLALTVVGYMHPQGFATGLMQGFPAYMALFASVVVAAILTRQWRWPGWDWRIVALLVFWAFLLFTTTQAKVPWAAWPRFAEISKIFLALGLTLLLIDTRQKLQLLMATIAASFALVTLKGGYWAVSTGFSDRVYGPPDSQYYDNNQFAIAVIMTIPLLVQCLRESRDRTLRAALMAAIALSYAAALSSWSRGALIALTLTTLVMLWHSQRRLLAVPLVVLAAGLAFVALPEGWFDRMASIGTYEADPSAQSRLVAWNAGLRNALAFPFTGVGLDGWHYALVTMDWHNSYVEMLAEHGFIGFGIWIALLVGTLVSLALQRQRHARDPATRWVADYSTALTASLVAYASGSLFLGLSYWDIFYHLIVISIVLTRIAARTAATEIERTGSRPSPDRAQLAG